MSKKNYTYVFVVRPASERERCIQKGFGELLLVKVGDEVFVECSWQPLEQYIKRS